LKSWYLAHTQTYALTKPLLLYLGVQVQTQNIHKFIHQFSLLILFQQFPLEIIYFQCILSL
jgi:hypothetical protein